MCHVPWDPSWLRNRFAMESSVNTETFSGWGLMDKSWAGLHFCGSGEASRAVVRKNRGRGAAQAQAQAQAQGEKQQEQWGAWEASSSLPSPVNVSLSAILMSCPPCSPPQHTHTPRSQTKPLYFSST